VTISVFSRGDEVLTPLDALLPFPTARFLTDGTKIWIERGRVRYELAKEKARLDMQHAQGFENEILVHTLRYEKDAHTNAIFDSIMANIDSGQRAGLKSKAMLHVDDDGHFFIRLDKPGLREGKTAITTGGDCYKFDFALAVYPKNERTIHESVRALFKS